MLTVVGIGGNALAPPGEQPTVGGPRRRLDGAAAALAPLARAGALIVTHGNGPQVGALALEQAAARHGAPPDPLDVLDALTEGSLGYLVGLALANAVPERTVVTVLTQVVVDAADPAFAAPSKPVGAIYPTRPTVDGWAVVAVPGGWRRAVASPEPRRVVELEALAALVAAGFVLVAAGGGGIPVVEDVDGRRGVEAVVDKDRTTALVATALGADRLVLLTDVAGVIDGFGTPAAELVRRLDAAAARDLAATLPPGSMGTKLEAASRFVAATGHPATIGSLADATAVLADLGGTRVDP